MDVLEIKTNHNTCFIDITKEINQWVKKNKVKEGCVMVFVPHTTAGLTINENADPAVVKDILKELNKVVPSEDLYEHLEGNSAAHIKASLLGFSQLLMVEDQALVLGTWQSVYFCEFDGPRTRRVFIKEV